MDDYIRARVMEKRERKRKRKLENEDGVLAHMISPHNVYLRRIYIFIYST